MRGLGLRRDVFGEVMKPGLHWVFDLPSFLMKPFQTGLAERKPDLIPGQVSEGENAFVFGVFGSEHSDP